MRIDAMLDYPLPVEHPLSPHSQLTHPQRAEYTVWLVPNAVMRECERPWLHVEYWGAYICLRPGELYLESCPLQGSCNYLCFMTSVCLAGMSWMGGCANASTSLPAGISGVRGHKRT